MISNFVDLSLSYLSKFIKFPNFSLNSLSDLIEFEEHLKNALILHGFNPYSQLYSLICDYNFKLVSFKFFLTRLYVYSITLRIRLVTNAKKQLFFRVVAIVAIDERDYSCLFRKRKERPLFSALSCPITIATHLEAFFSVIREYHLHFLPLFKTSKSNQLVF